MPLNFSWDFSTHFLVSGTSFFVLSTSCVNVLSKFGKLFIVYIWKLYYGVECKVAFIDLTNSIISLMNSLCGGKSTRQDYTPPFSFIDEYHLGFNDSYFDANKLSIFLLLI